MQKIQMLPQSCADNQKFNVSHHSSLIAMMKKQNKCLLRVINVMWDDVTLSCFVILQSYLFSYIIYSHSNTVQY